MPINANRAGLVVAVLGGGWHLLWSGLVASGLAQVIVDFIFWMHFIRPVYVIESFSIDRAVILIVVTSVLGYGIGYCGGALWNWFHRVSSPSPTAGAGLS